MTRTLVIGDVHGCADELDQILRTAKADRVVFVGDLFTKGPDPAGVFALAKGHEAVLGNHDIRLLEWLAGERPNDAHAAEVGSQLDARADGWRELLVALPLFVEAGGFTVVHAGLHPSGELDRTSRRMATLMRRFPMNDPTAPFWHSVYRGSRRVVFGHDALRGLIRVARDGHPWLIGLDTGCVYGGALSAYLIEEDRVLQVPARRVYWAPRTKPV